MTNDKAGNKTEYIGFKDCFATTTLSFTNAITGVLGAWQDNVPMLV